MTMIEAVIAMTIIAIVVSLSVTAIHRARASALRAACANNLRNTSLAVHVYLAHHDHYPQGCAYPFSNGVPYPSGHVGVSWHTSILPYVEQSKVMELAWAAISLDPAGTASAHEQPQNQVVSVFLCPSEVRRHGGGSSMGTWALKSYAGVAGTEIHSETGMFHLARPTRASDVADGMSSTIMIGERPPGPGGMYGAWYGGWGNCTCPVAQLQSAPRSVETADCPPSPPLAAGSILDPCAVRRFWSPHPGGANFAFADGSVRFLPYSANGILPALATRAGGEVVEIP